MLLTDLGTPLHSSAILAAYIRLTGGSFAFYERCFYYPVVSCRTPCIRQHSIMRSVALDWLVERRGE